MQPYVTEGLSTVDSASGQGAQMFDEAGELANVRLFGEGLTFPEGPVAMDDGTLIVVEMLAGRVTRVTSAGNELIAETGGGPNGLAIGPDGALYVCNNDILRTDGAGHIQRIDLATGKCERIIESVDGQTLGAPNDIVFDATGGFWFTDIGREHLGVIYYVDRAGDAKAAVRFVDRPNGIGLSPDGGTLYWAETDTRRVVRRRVLEPGVLAPTRGDAPLTVLRGHPTDTALLVAGMPGNRRLDSLAVDGHGHVAVGTIMDSGISDVDPDTGSVTLLRLPEWAADRLVTNICFGGPDMRTAFITLSETGRVVACDWPRPGLELNFNA